MWLISAINLVVFNQIAGITRMHSVPTAAAFGLFLRAMMKLSLEAACGLHIL